MDLLKFTINKKYIYIYILNGVVALAYNQVYCQICQKFSYVGPKKNLGLSQKFFKDKKNHKILKFIHNSNYFFLARVVMWPP